MPSGLTSILGSPHFHALSLIIVSTAALQAFIAIWAAASHRHWFLRALAVWAAITALLPIRAYQPALVFAISSPLIVGACVLLVTRVPPGHAPTRGSPLADLPTRSLFRFSLLDLLLVTALAGLILTSLLYLLPRLGQLHFAEFAVVTATQTVLPTLAWAAVTAPRPRFFRGALFVAFVGCLALFYSIRRFVGTDWTLLGVVFESRWGADIPLTPLAELCLLLIVGITLVHTSGHLRVTRAALGVMAAMWAIGLALIYCQMLWLTPLPPTFSTGPNNYPRLIEISSQMTDLRRAGFPAASEPERLSFIAETVSLVEVGSYVPYDPAVDATLDRWSTVFLNPAQRVRDLARNIDSECGAALAKGDKDRACDLALTNVRLGLMLQRGGTIVEYLIGSAVQGIALNRLATMRADISFDQARRIIAAWDRALAEQEHVEAVIYRDSSMAERPYGWAYRLCNILEQLGLPSQTFVATDESVLRRETTVRLLQTELALRLYKIDHGKLPATLDQLVPAYLATLPLDSYSQQPLIYRPTGDGFLLYSIGHDRTDNGGRFTNTRTYYSRGIFGNLNHNPGYDYDLDTPTRP